MTIRGAVLTGLLGFGVGLMGCANGRNTVTGRIKPEDFEFTSVVEKPEPPDEPGGWWAVCIHAVITEGDSGAKSACKFEVGMPQRSLKQGDISFGMAQDASADMANRAAYKVLSEAPRGTMIGVHCSNFKKLYKLMLSEKIYGADVSACTTKGVKTVHFNVPCDCD